MRKLKTWWTDLRWLNKSERLFLLLPLVGLTLMLAGSVALALAGQWIAVFPALAFIGILMETLNYIQITVRHNRWWDDWRTQYELQKAEDNRKRKEQEWDL